MFSVVNLEAMVNDIVLFEAVNFSLDRGDILQIEGENGSGKTTLLRFLIGLSVPEYGDILWDGQSIYQDKINYLQNMAYLGHKNAIKEELTCSENLIYNTNGSNKADSENEALLILLGLLDCQHVLVRTLSAGQKRRLSMIRILQSDVMLWVLDEPFTSIDMKGIELLQQCFEEHLDNGGMIILTSHQQISMKHSVHRMNISP